MAEDGERRAETRGRRSEIGDLRPEVGGRMAEVGWRRAERLKDEETKRTEVGKLKSRNVGKWKSLKD
jgi:hypothetical protein